MTAESDTFAQFLDAQHYDASTIVQACRYLVALQTDDLPLPNMRDELVELTDATRTEEVLRILSTDAELLERAALAALSIAWQDDDGPEAVKGAFNAARGKLPVIEVGIIATAVMYSVYMIITQGVRKKVTVVERQKNGTFKIHESIEYFGPTGPLNAITRIFRADTPFLASQRDTAQISSDRTDDQAI